MRLPSNRLQMLGFLVLSLFTFLLVNIFYPRVKISHWQEHSHYLLPCCFLSHSVWTVRGTKTRAQSRTRCSAETHTLKYHHIDCTWRLDNWSTSWTPWTLGNLRSAGSSPQKVQLAVHVVNSNWRSSSTYGRHLFYLGNDAPKRWYLHICLRRDLSYHCDLCLDMRCM